MKKFAIVVALSIASLAHSQEIPKPATKPERPAIATPDNKAPTAPVPGEHSFTEGQAKQRIEEKGYIDVTGLSMGGDGIWTASAKKDGKAVEVNLDFQGNITEIAQ